MSSPHIGAGRPDRRSECVCAQIVTLSVDCRSKRALRAAEPNCRAEPSPAFGALHRARAAQMGGQAAQTSARNPHRQSEPIEPLCVQSRTRGGNSHSGVRPHASNGRSELTAGWCAQMGVLSSNEQFGLHRARTISAQAAVRQFGIHSHIKARCARFHFRVPVGARNARCAHSAPAWVPRARLGPGAWEGVHAGFCARRASSLSLFSHPSRL